MDIRRFEEFLAVLDAGSLSKAAEILGVAQPALSQSLARLERELGVRLFHRSRRGAEPTAAARQIAEDVRSGVFRITNAKDAAQAIAQGRAGVLRVGLVSSALIDILRWAAHMRLPEILKWSDGIRTRLTHGSDLGVAAVVAAAQRQRAQLKNPPIDVDRYLEILFQQGLVQTTKALATYCFIL
ncbi:LysR family transcriptional regulator [Bordetella petrii]|uniref:LysR family transcriptional regulator n=1 Tax=Bordetella petrii TaxID=94624 RepID=UPI0004AFB7F3|nr:LysR family transcriptional regulator [Bordetella petrii]